MEKSGIAAFGTRTAGAWWKAGLLMLLMVWIYAPILLPLVAQWCSEPNFSHGFFVPVFSGYVLWQNRSYLSKVPRSPSWWGLGLIVFALAILVVGVLGAELFLSRISLVFLLAGLTVLFLGW